MLSIFMIPKNQSHSDQTYRIQIISILCVVLWCDVMCCSILQPLFSFIWNSKFFDQIFGFVNFLSVHVHFIRSFYIEISNSCSSEWKALHTNNNTFCERYCISLSSCFYLIKITVDFSLRQNQNRNLLISFKIPF